MVSGMILDHLRAELLRERGALPPEYVMIRGVWKVHCLFQPSSKERMFRYVFLVSQTLNQGCAYCIEDHYDADFLRSLLGKNYLDLDIRDRGLDISLLDAVYASFPRSPSKVVTLSGDSATKAIQRARLIVDEGTRLLGSPVHGHRTQTVVNVGAVGHIVHELLDRNYNVLVTDFDPEIIGLPMLDRTPVCSGDRTLEFVAAADLAIVTGMALTTDTLDDILSTAKANDTKLLVFAETGSSFAPMYVSLGVDCVVAEPFPFYIFQGTTTIEVHRRARSARMG